MTKKTTLFLWLLFILIIPILYFMIKNIILPNTENVEMIMLFAPYLFSICTIMYRIDERFYFFIKSITQWFCESYTSWSFSTRYEKINDCNKILKDIQDGLIKIGCKTIKNEHDYLNVVWNERNMLNFRIEKNDNDEHSLHFYTSIIDVPFKSMKQKIKEFSVLYENIENNIGKSSKIYEIEITYRDSSPYYTFWVKTLHSEKIIKFNCAIRDNDGIINVDKNKIRYCTSSLHRLFFKIEKYLNLRGD